MSAIEKSGVNLSADIESFKNGSFDISKEADSYNFDVYIDALADNNTVIYQYFWCDSEDTAKALFLHFYNICDYDSEALSGKGIRERGIDKEYVFIDGEYLKNLDNNSSSYLTVICRIKDKVIVVDTNGSNESQADINRFLDTIGLPHD